MFTKSERGIRERKQIDFLKAFRDYKSKIPHSTSKNKMCITSKIKTEIRTALSSFYKNSTDVLTHLLTSTIP